MRINIFSYVDFNKKQSFYIHKEIKNARTSIQKEVRACEINTKKV